MYVCVHLISNNLLSFIIISDRFVEQAIRTVPNAMRNQPMDRNGLRPTWVRLSLIFYNRRGVPQVLLIYLPCKVSSFALSARALTVTSGPTYPKSSRLKSTHGRGIRFLFAVFLCELCKNFPEMPRNSPILPHRRNLWRPAATKWSTSNTKRGMLVFLRLGLLSSCLLPCPFEYQDATWFQNHQKRPWL